MPSDGFVAISINIRVMSDPSFRSSPAAPIAPLERALDQNENIKAAVVQSADELLVIHAVLQQEIPAHVQTGDVAQALQKTNALESTIQDTAVDLAQVNQLLVQEINERDALERELAATKAALAQAKDQAA